jgi:hypothetical protein
LPDGIFSNQKSRFGQILEGLEMYKNAGIFNGYLEYIMAIWYIPGPFGNLEVIWYILTRKIWQPRFFSIYSIFALKIVVFCCIFWHVFVPNLLTPLPNLKIVE